MRVQSEDVPVNTSTLRPGLGLPRDPPLAAFGHTQAQELADHFLSLPEEERPTAIFSSPYCTYLHVAPFELDVYPNVNAYLKKNTPSTDRCLQTSKPVANALNVPIYVEHGEHRKVPTPSPPDVT